MLFKKTKKRGISALASIAAAILALSLLFIIPSVIYTGSMNPFNAILGLAGRTLNQTEFTPYEEQLNPEEITVENSMQALRLAIEYTALEKELNGNAKPVVMDFDEYEIVVYTQLGVNWQLGDEVMKFSRRFKAIPGLSSQWVYADFTSPDLKEVNHGLEEDDVLELKHYAEIEGINDMHNIELKKYKNGRLISECKVSTIGKGSSSEFDGRGLLTYKPGEEKCENSRTWLQCDGIHINYCGVTGENTNPEKYVEWSEYEKNDYFIIDSDDGKFHSKTAARFLIDINPGYKENDVSVARHSWTDEWVKDTGIIKFSTVGFFISATTAKGIDCTEGVVGKVKRPNGQEVDIGNVCVKCTDKQCIVKGFELPQETTGGMEWIDGYGDPKYLAYYESFPVGESAAWKVDMDTAFIAATAIQGVLAVVPVIGKASKAISTSFKARRLASISAKMTKVAKDAKKLTRLRKVQQELIATMLEGSDDVAKTVGRIYKATSVSKVSKVPGMFVDDAIETTLKNIDEEIGHVIGNRWSKIKYDGVGAKISGTLEPASLKTPNYYFSSTTNRLKEAGKNRLKERLKSIISGADDKIDDIVEKVSKETFESVDDATAKISKEISKELHDDIVLTGYKLANANIGKLGKFVKIIGYKNFIKAIVAGDLDKVSAKALKSAGLLKKINKKHFANAIKEIDDLAGSLVDDTTGVVNWGRLFGTETDKLLTSQGDDVLSKIIKISDQGSLNTYGKNINKFSELFKGRNMGKGLYEGAMHQLGFQGKGLQRLASFAKYQVKGLGCLSIPVLVELGIVSAGSSPLTGSIGIGGALTAGSAVGKLLKPCGAFIRQYQLPLLLYLAYQFSFEDSVNEKFTPAGENTLVLNMPNWVGGPNNLRPYNVDLGNSNLLYVSMHRDESQTPTDFHLASPCKTDLIVKKEYCSGNLYSEDYLLEYEFEDRKYLQPLRSLELDKQKQEYVYYLWDKADDELKGKLLNRNLHASTWGRFWTNYGSKTLSNIVTEILQDEDYLKEALILLYKDNPEKLIESFKNTTTNDYPINTYEPSFQQLCLNLNFDNKMCKDFSIQDTWNGVSEDDVADTHEITIASYDNVNNETKEFITYVEKELKDIKKQEFSIFVEKLIDDVYSLKNMTKQGVSTPHGLILIHHLMNQIFNHYHLGFNREFIINSSKLENHLYYDSSVGNQIKLYQRINNKESFMERMARQVTAKFYIFKESDIPKESRKNIVKEFTKELDYSEDQDLVEIQKIKNPYELIDTYSPKSTVPCITVKTSIETSYDAYGNYDPNFCYFGENAVLKKIEKVLIYGGLALSVAAIPFTGGASLGFTATIVAVDLGAAATSYYIKSARKWPNHQ